MTRPFPELARCDAAGWCAGATALVLYVSTTSGLAGSHDAAQFQAIAATGGIAHAGYPLLALVLQLFGHLPFGSMALRANLLSCLAGAVAVGFAAAAGARVARSAAAGFAAGLALALSRTLWHEATFAGVHAFTLAIDAALFCLAWSFARQPRPVGAGLIGWLFGCGLVSHLTVLGFAPVLAAALGCAIAHRRLRRSHLAAAAVGLLLGLLPLVNVPLQDRPGRPMNYIEDTLDESSGEYLPADTPPLSRLERSVWLLSARQYLAHHYHRPFRNAAFHVKLTAAHVALNDFPLAGTLFALVGAIVLASPASRASAPCATLLLAGGFVGVTLMLLVGAAREMLAIFFLPGLWLLSIALAAGLGTLRRWPVALAGAALAVTALPFVRLAMPDPPGFGARSVALAATWAEWPREWSPLRRDDDWDRWGRATLRTVAAHATIIALWEEAETLRYLQYGAKLRRDVAVRLMGHPVRVARAIAAAEQAGRPVYVTFAPDAAALAGRALVREPVAGPRALWRVEGPLAPDPARP